jgi:hypothetical protein
MKRDEIYEVTAFDHLRSLGLKAQPTDSNAFQVRREAGAGPMNRLVSGRPGLLVHKRCLKPESHSAAVIISSVNRSAPGKNG